MSFRSGQVSFCRFLVEGDAPQAVDDAFLGTLADHAFVEQDIGAPMEIEAGFVTGEHIFDTEFSYEKNGFGMPGDAMALLALRIDTNRVPSDVKQAYRRMQEAAMAAERDNPTGFLSKREKREAKEYTDRQLRDDLASGKYRRSKSVPVLWDLPRGMLYCGSSSNTVMEQVYNRFREAFNVKLQPMTAGTLASHLLRDKGLGRDYEDLRPSPFTAPPEEARREGDAIGGEADLTIPTVPWTQKSTDMKDFLGNEFAIWLWHLCETQEGLVELNAAPSKTEMAMMIDKALDMDCAWGVLGKQSLRGTGPTRLGEAGEALSTGKWPRKLGLIAADTDEGHQWSLTLQVDRMIVSSAALPEIEEASGPRELIEGRLALVRRLAECLDGLYTAFLSQRTSGNWPGRRDTIRRWVAAKGA